MNYYDRYDQAKREERQEVVDAHNTGFRNGKACNQRGLEAVKGHLRAANERNKLMKAQMLQYRALLDYVDTLMEGSNTDFAQRLRATLYPQKETTWQSIKRFMFSAVAQFFM